MGEAESASAEARARAENGGHPFRGLTYDASTRQTGTFIVVNVVSAREVVCRRGYYSVCGGCGRNGGDGGGGAMVGEKGRRGASCGLGHRGLESRREGSERRGLYI